MNIDTTTDDDGISVEWTVTDERAANNIQITDPKRCQNPLCNNLTSFGSDYCSRHRPEKGSLEDITNPSPIRDSVDKVSNRDIQRQLDRIEGKLDALLNDD